MIDDTNIIKDYKRLDNNNNQYSIRCIHGDYHVGEVNPNLIKHGIIGYSTTSSNQVVLSNRIREVIL